MRKLLIILSLMSLATIMVAQSYVIRENAQWVYENGSWVYEPADPTPPVTPTINEAIGRGFTAGDITTNNGTADNLWSEQVYDDLQAAGTDNIRIVFWYPNDSGSDPWTITPSVLTNLAIIVDKLIDHGMVAIIDYHQPMMKRDNLYNQDNIDRWVSHWGQMADHFSSYDSLDVVYEPLNEPEYDALAEMSLSDWNDMQQDVIDEIRLYDTEKAIFITPYQWSKLEYLDDMTVPTDPSNRLILSLHYYEPKDRSDLNDWPNIKPFWDNLEYYFQRVDTWQAANPNIDITIGEWGTKATAATPGRYNYARMHANYFVDKGYSASWWDYSAWEFEVDTSESMIEAILSDDLPEFESHDSTLIYQSDFSVDTDGWSTWTELGGAVSLSTNGTQLVCNVTNGSTGGTNSVRVRAPTFTITNGKMYRISYDISGTKSFCADQLYAGVNWWNIEELAGGGTFTRTYTFEMTGTTIASNYVQFYLGGSTGLFYIDNMTIEEITVGVVADNQEIIWEQDFESTAIQDPYTSANIQNDFPWKTNWTDGKSRSSYIHGTPDLVDFVAVESVDGSRVMTNKYGPNAWGADQTGINMVSVFAQGYDGDLNEDEVYLSYNIKFSAGFEWGLGGKLPGIAAYPFTFNAGAPPLDDEGGFYIMMWQPSGTAKYYDYWHDNDPPDYQWGQGPNIGTTFVADQWYNVTQRLVMSDVWSSNAIHEIFIDGVLVWTYTGVMYRKESFIGFNSIEWATFQGGNDASYGTPGDHRVYMDDARLWCLTGPGTAEHPVGTTVSPAGRDISTYIIQK